VFAVQAGPEILLGLSVAERSVFVDRPDVTTYQPDQDQHEGHEGKGD
jgi:hypothetical protein